MKQKVTFAGLRLSFGGFFFVCLFFKQWLAYPDVFKKIRDTKGTFHAKMGTIKGRNGMHVTKAKDINKR